MAKVKYVRAAKDHPAHGIKKGEMYYVTAIKTGPRSSRTLRSKTPFKRSQLTSSEYLGQLYDIEDDIAALSSMDDAQDIVDRLRQLGEEQSDKLSNMPEGLQQGDTGQLLQERADACEQATSDIEEIISDWENREKEEEKPEEGEEETEDEAEDEDSFVSRVQEVSIG